MFIKIGNDTVNTDYIVHFYPKDVKYDCPDYPDEWCIVLHFAKEINERGGTFAWEHFFSKELRDDVLCKLQTLCKAVDLGLPKD